MEGLSRYCLDGISGEQGLLFIAIPIGAVLLYAGSTALKSRRKWKYSYLK